MTTVEEAKVVVDRLVTILQHGDLGLTVNEVIKAGSLGHGTPVPGDFDLDLVIYSSDVDAREIRDTGARGKRTPSGDIDTGYVKYLHRLRSFLGSVPRVRLNQAKPHAVNFSYCGIDVDLLVSPNWPDPYACWTFLQDVDQDHFSVNVSKWQVEFFSDEKVSSQVKEFIKRAKAWRNKKWSHSHVEYRSHTSSLSSY